MSEPKILLDTNIPMNFDDVEKGNEGLPSGTGEAGLTGLLGAALNLGGKIIDSKYPTNNQPAAALANQQQSQAKIDAVKPVDYKPYIIVGGIALVSLIGIALIVRK